MKIYQKELRMLPGGPFERTLPGEDVFCWSSPFDKLCLLYLFFSSYHTYLSQEFRKKSFGCVYLYLICFEEKFFFQSQFLSLKKTTISKDTFITKKTINLKEIIKQKVKMSNEPYWLFICTNWQLQGFGTPHYSGCTSSYLSSYCLPRPLGCVKETILNQLLGS